MDPSQAYKSDQASFELELEQLIAEGLAESSSETMDHSHDRHDTPLKRSHSPDAPETERRGPAAATKRLKAAAKSSQMHPERQAELLDMHEDLTSPTSPPQETETGHPRSYSVQPPGATVANRVPLGPRQAQPNAVPTLHNTIQRQWDPRRDVGYEDLLKYRRQEKPRGVDRYVPLWSPESGKRAKPKKYLPFERLPEKAHNKIFELLLVSADPIEIDFSWLKPFVKGHARVPLAVQTLENGEGASYRAPVPWEKLRAEVFAMQSDMAQFKSALETRGVKTKWKRSPARTMTTGLLRVSRSVHEAAASVFYGQNTFHFSYAAGAWMQLESFLNTISARNVRLVKSIRITAPMFHRGIHEDYIEGAILDSISPATRMAVVKPPPRDRLLVAVKAAANMLMAAGTLEKLAIDLAHPKAAEDWDGSYVNDKRLISLAETEEHVQRKVAGIAQLKQVSVTLAAKGSKPVLTLYHFTSASKSERHNFRGRLPNLRKEADKYGWTVNSQLQDGK